MMKFVGLFFKALEAKRYFFPFFYIWAKSIHTHQSSSFIFLQNSMHSTDF